MADTYATYQSENISLARSLVIKFDIQNTLMNERLQQAGIHVASQAPETWKYNLNLAGLHHPMDQPIEVVSNDTQQVISFDKETLKNHPRTLQEYQIGVEDYQTNLIAQYPTQRLFINSVVRDITLTQVLEAEDFEILSWDSSLVAENELELIPKIQTFINAFVSRWWIPDMVLTDKLYPAAFFALLNQNIVQEIDNIRKQASHTEEASQFHVWAFLSGHYGLDRFRTLLSTKQSLWLYRNINWLRRTAGRTKILDELIDNLVKGSGLKISKLRVLADEDDFLTTKQREGFYAFLDYDLDNIQEASYAKISTDEAYKLTEDAGLSNELEREIDVLESKVIEKYSKGNDHATGFIKADQDGSVVSQTLERTSQRWKYHIYLAAKGFYAPVFEIPLPNGRSRFLNAKDAAILYYYSLMSYLGIEPQVVPRFNAVGVMPVTYPSITTLRKYTPEEYVPDSEIFDLIDLQLNIPVISDSVGFEKFITDVLDVKVRHGLYSDTKSSVKGKSIARALTDQFWTTEECLLAPAGTRFIDWLTTVQINKYDFVEQDWYDVSQSILSVVTGSDSESIGLPADQQAVISIIDSLTSYNIRLLEGYTEGKSYTLDVPGTITDILGISVDNEYDFSVTVDFSTRESEIKQSYHYDIGSPLNQSWDASTAQNFFINEGLDIGFFRDGKANVELPLPNPEITIDKLDD